MTTLKYTLDQVRERQVALIGTTGLPNAWWPLPAGNDCLAFQLTQLGIRRRSDLVPHFISIAAFRAWSGWDEVARSDIRPGDIALENWSGGHDPEHAEFVYSIDHARGVVSTISANTGPHPGTPNPRGVWRKTRPIGEWLLTGIRPPYRNPASTATTHDRAKVRLTAGYLNKVLPPGTPRTAAEDDGIRGPVYWMAVQTWGRLHDQYGPNYQIDGIPGPRSRTVEAVVYAKAKAAKR
jgi:hypothetical protein